MSAFLIDIYYISPENLLHSLVARHAQGSHEKLARMQDLSTEEDIIYNNNQICPYRSILGP